MHPQGSVFSAKKTRHKPHCPLISTTKHTTNKKLDYIFFFLNKIRFHFFIIYL